ncbi:hypothetical protein GCM10017771_49810 [Streptomyces capitiformicae]|uniref:Uncharacterized protein n=1 Tax=Streptomyces capitiformicae TaxID=2014920 RepID=A0A918Z1G2_9ACTN|nr:hypothetical protein GCM10017771_49810 [Streptomyces capitiformicae]
MPRLSGGCGRVGAARAVRRAPAKTGGTPGLLGARDCIDMRLRRVGASNHTPPVAATKPTAPNRKARRCHRAAAPRTRYAARAPVRPRARYAGSYIGYVPINPMKPDRIRLWTGK